ncbi:mucin-associated surface protein (MASP), partial [Trypanosoma cruzi]
MMAMMMTGRVLLVCALCVLWRGVSVVAADADDCVRRGMDGVRAFGDGHRVWRRQRSAVVAGDDTTDDDSTRGSSSEVQTETETGSLDGRPPKPSVKSIPGEVPDGQDSGKISEASVPTINGTGENLDGDEEEGDVSQDESQEDRDGEDEAVDAAVGNGDRETSHTEHEEEKERVEGGKSRKHDKRTRRDE